MWFSSKLQFVTSHPRGYRWPIDKEKIASQQRDFLLDCIYDNLWSKIYDDCWLVSDFYRELDGMSYDRIVNAIVSKLDLSYYKNISDYIISTWLTKENPLYMGRTSGTSDGNNGGKDIPVTATSLDTLEHDAIWNTLYCVAQYDIKKASKIFTGKALTLTASFDGCKGYISGIMRHGVKSFQNRLLYPLSDINTILDMEEKKEAILMDLQKNKYKISSAHGVPTRSLEVLSYIIDRDTDLAKRLLSNFTYVSIWWWPPLDYKHQYQSLLNRLNIKNNILASNNHNATEWFFGSQLSCFDDLDYHWMVPHIYGNWFGYIKYTDYLHMDHYRPTIYTLDTVEQGIDYIQVTLNYRIPVPYIVKDVVRFNSDGGYIVSWRIGMSSNIANEHIEQKHILECLSYLHFIFPRLSDYYAVAGMEMTDDHKLRFHFVIESDDTNLDTNLISIKIHEWFVSHHEQYSWFVKKWKITWSVVYLIPAWSLIWYLRSIWRWHEQSKIPHVWDTNYKDIISKIVNYR